MNKIAFIALALIFSSDVFATDKDILREACGALKVAAKRSQCFDIIEKLPVTQPQTSVDPKSEQPQKLTLNVRAFQCDHFEFAELDAMKKEELEAATCSITAGERINTEASDKRLEQQSDPAIKVDIANQSVAYLQKCYSENSKIKSILRRKFPDATIDCSKMPGKFGSPSPTESSPKI